MITLADVPLLAIATISARLLGPVRAGATGPAAPSGNRSIRGGMG